MILKKDLRQLFLRPPNVDTVSTINTILFDNIIFRMAVMVVLELALIIVVANSWLFALLCVGPTVLYAKQSLVPHCTRISVNLVY